MGQARIRECWAELAGQRRKAVIPFITAGFPRARATQAALLGAVEAGSDLIELGVPFSDPLADGPAIQHSSQIALDQQVDLVWLLTEVERFRRRSDTPVLLMGYYNPFLQYGLRTFCTDARSAGVDGLIIPDLPPEEARPLHRCARAASLSMVYLIAPTTTDDRIRSVARRSTDFCYCVSVTGVTGARSKLPSKTLSYLRRVKRLVRKPIVVGFGISTPAHVRTFGRAADGVVVGSALVPILASGGSPKSIRDSIRRALKPLVRAARDL